MPRRPRCGKFLTYGWCVLTPGHSGFCWDGGAETAPPPPRLKTWGSTPLPGGLDDVAALKAAARAQALALARAGARLPKELNP